MIGHKAIRSTEPFVPVRHRPLLSDQGRDASREILVVDQSGQRRMVAAAGESALTVTVDSTQIVTLMTLGSAPEKLVLGYLRNQLLVERLGDIVSVVVDWALGTARVETSSGAGVDALSVEPRHRIITTGCGQGTIYSCTLDRLYEYRLPDAPVSRSSLYEALAVAGRCNPMYRRTGSVHGCVLVGEGRVLCFVEDVGRHNAVDSIAGDMWLSATDGAGKMLYTTGRLTSEIVMKAAMMGVNVLISRNGVTHMAIELAEDLGVMLVARAKSRRFQIFSCHRQLVLDDPGGLDPLPWKAS